jgi:hypothetical protein
MRSVSAVRRAPLASARWRVVAASAAACPHSASEPLGASGVLGDGRVQRLSLQPLQGELVLAALLVGPGGAQFGEDVVERAEFGVADSLGRGEFGGAGGAELVRLPRELRVAKMAIEILKKASAYIADPCSPRFPTGPVQIRSRRIAPRWIELLLGCSSASPGRRRSSGHGGAAAQRGP